jgi:hypothetical protein
MNKWKVLIIHTGHGTTYKQYRGLSTWEKPMDGPETGDELLEMDTGNVFMFDSETPKWWPM